MVRGIAIAHRIERRPQLKSPFTVHGVNKVLPKPTADPDLALNSIWKSAGSLYVSKRVAWLAADSCNTSSLLQQARVRWSPISLLPAPGHDHAG